MLGWALFLRLASKAQVQAFHQRVASAILLKRTRAEQIGELQGVYTEVMQLVGTSPTVPSHVRAFPRAGDEKTLDQSPEVIWLGHGADPALRASWLRQIPVWQREHLGVRDVQVLAACRFLFTNKDVTPEDRRYHIVAENVPSSTRAYLHLRHFELLITPTGPDPEGAAGLDFFVVPPEVPRSSVEDRTSTPTEQFAHLEPIGSSKAVKRDLSEAWVSSTLQSSLLNSLFDWTAPQLIGALGVWTLFIIYRHGNLDPDEQESLRTGLKVMPYVGLIRTGS
jgi:hypothetical protein